MNDLPFEDNPPITEPPQEGDLDHDAAGDDGEEAIVCVTQAEAQAGSDHPANPGGLYPIPPKPVLTEWIAISNAERLEKGELYAKKMVEIEGMEAERSDITSEIGKAKKLAVLLRNAFLSGKVEVPAEQTDLLRQPVGPESAAAQFEEMGRAAQAAGILEVADAAQEAAEATQGLNAMAAGIQADQGIQEPGPGFLNDIEEHKAKSAAKRKGKK